MAAMTCADPIAKGLKIDAGGEINEGLLRNKYNAFCAQNSLQKVDWTGEQFLQARGLRKRFPAGHDALVIGIAIAPGGATVALGGSPVSSAAASGLAHDSLDSASAVDDEPWDEAKAVEVLAERRKEIDEEKRAREAAQAELDKESEASSDSE